MLQNYEEITLLKEKINEVFQELVFNFRKLL